MNKPAPTASAVWLGSMAARIFALLLVGIVAAAALAFSVADLQNRGIARRDREQRMVDRVADLAVFLAATPSALRPASLGPGPEAPRLDDSTTSAAPLDEDLTARLSARLGEAARAQASEPLVQGCGRDPPGPAENSPRPPPPVPAIAPPPPDVAQQPPLPPPPTCRRIALTLASGERVRLLVPSGPQPPAPGLPHALNLAFLLVVAAAAAILAFATAQIASGPLSRLARAARALGDDLDRPPLQLEGPLEVRQAAQAFNAMQSRLKQHLDERTYMLAAITHDLQTPLTRQRLRLEKVLEPQLRQALLADYDAMQTLIRDGLDLARASSGADGMVELDVDSLLDSLCADAVDAGFQVTVSAACGCTVVTRPAALKRCLSNLLDNALKYAGPAELRAEQRGPEVVIAVLDRGPGIDPRDLDTIMDPFVRGDPSRSRETGGAGLGLTIAKLLAERSAGNLAIANRPECGLAATITLPQARR